MAGRKGMKWSVEKRAEKLGMSVDQFQQFRLESQRTTAPQKSHHWVSGMGHQLDRKGRTSLYYRSRLRKVKLGKRSLQVGLGVKAYTASDPLKHNLYVRLRASYIKGSLKHDGKVDGHTTRPVVSHTTRSRNKWKKTIIRAGKFGYKHRGTIGATGIGGTAFALGRKHIRKLGRF